MARERGMWIWTALLLGGLPACAGVSAKASKPVTSTCQDLETFKVQFDDEEPGNTECGLEDPPTHRGSLAISRSK